MSRNKERSVLLHPYSRKVRPLSQYTPVEYIKSYQHTGRSYVRLSQLHPALLHQMNTHLNLQSIPFYLSTLDAMSVAVDYDDDSAMAVLKRLYGSMVNFEARRNQDEVGAGTDAYTTFTKTVIEQGGLEILLRLFMSTAILPPSSPHCRDSGMRLRTKSLIIQILYRFNSVCDKIPDKLLEYEELPNYLLELFVYDKTCNNACSILEDMLQAMDNVFNLSTIPNLRPLVLSLTDDKLATFCRILAVSISDLDIYENKSSLFAQNRQKRTKGFVNVRDINQELLLNIPDVLPRLVRLVCQQKYTPRYREQTSEVENWMSWIEDAMAEDVFDISRTDDLDNFVGGVSEPSSLSGALVRQSGLHIGTELVLRVQVIYVLGLFLVGKHRKKVQRKLAEMCLVPGLSDLFDQFIWKCQTLHSRSSNHQNLRGHRNVCECSPEVAMKIQFLRLVHSFCDHSEYKHLLLSKSELNEIKRINCKVDKEYQVDHLDEIDRHLMCRGSKGLLTKIVEVMKKEPTASTFRFWLARAIESYLRGGTSQCDQVFLLRRGLLHHIACNIVDNDIRPKEILQSSFDLLGELVKFNHESFQNFDKVFTTQDKFEKFLKVVNKNLVDSNMFIRSLILTYEHLWSRLELKSQAETTYWGSKLLKHIASFDQQMAYLERLITQINVLNLTQENVSCLNTTLVFLMFANKKRALGKYLRALATMERPTYRRSGAVGDCAGRTGPDFMSSFRDLLLFWQDHYLHKDKDCSALERSSRISFDYWKQTVNTMVADDRDNDTCLKHYMEIDYGVRMC